MVEQCLKGKRVMIVGGGGSGIGGECTRLLGAAGGELVIVDIDQAKAQDAAAKVVAAGGTAVGLSGDIRTEQSIARLVGETLDAVGQIDVLVMVVGGLNASKVRPAKLLDMSDASWDAVFDMNLRYVVRLTRAVVRSMLDRRIPGSLVGIGSYAGGFHGSPMQAPYGAAKIGLSHLAMTVSNEYGPDGIRMNVVAPGWTDTPAGGQRPHASEILETIPLRRRGTSTDIAHAVLFLASDAASYISGHTLAVDGGLAATSHFLAVLNNQPIE